MAISEEEKEDIVFAFHEGLDVYDLTPPEAVERICRLGKQNYEEVLAFLVSDHRLTEGGLEAVSWAWDRESPSLYAPDWEWYLSLLIRRKGCKAILCCRP
jgi:hypothetical protein